MPEMDIEFIKYLPSDIIINILSRLSVRSIIICKCVCKSWLSLLGTDEFAKFHLSRSVSGLACGQTSQKDRSFFEFNDDLDLERHELHYELVFKFNIPVCSVILSSTNGLLFLLCTNKEGDCLYICNPITRNYIKLHCPIEFVCTDSDVVTYGFGASKLTGQHKVVRIFSHYTRNIKAYAFRGVTKSECHVYTLGTGLWRSIAFGDPLDYRGNTTGAFVNGNLHWLACDLNGSHLISCFDLEREVFSTFPCPLLPGSRGFDSHLSVIGDCLCYSEVRTGDGMIIWLLKEYGAEQCWTKEFVISNSYGEFCKFFQPVKVFRDGDILMAPFMFGYSTKTKTTHEICKFEQVLGDTMSIIHTPSFLSLKRFGVETAISF